MPRWARVAIVLVAINVLIIAALVAFEEQIAFPGWAFGKAMGGPPPNAVVEEQVLRSASGEDIAAWWLPSPDWSAAKGAVIYIHGNGENLSTCGRALVRWRDELGTGVLGIDYPGYGKSSGRPGEESCQAAAHTAFQWLLQKKKVAPRDIIIVGQSMGAAFAIDLATRERCRLLVTSGAFTSLPDMAQHRFFWLPVRPFVHLQLNNLERVRVLQTPVFLSHGTADHVVPFAQGQQLFDAAKEPKRFYPVEGGHHAQPKTPEFYEAVRAFLRELAG